MTGLMMWLMINMLQLMQKGTWWENSSSAAKEVNAQSPPLFFEVNLRARAGCWPDGVLRRW
jgi:hypothetical protein